MPFEYRANIVRVIDGDTIEVDIDLGFTLWLRNQTIRLLGVDCPETRSRDKEEVVYGKMAKKFVEDFCAECVGQVLIQTEIEDVIGSNREKFGRILANVLNEKSGESLNDLLLDKFLAVPYYGKESKAELKAKHKLNREKINEQHG